MCLLENWLEDGLLQAIAEENNLSETAFFVPTEKGFSLRWFTPVQEVDLCGLAIKLFKFSWNIKRQQTLTGYDLLNAINLNLTLLTVEPCISQNLPECGGF